MSIFKPNDKVVCIDATPIPIGSPGDSYIDFDFPNGFIEEGAVYCVSGVRELWEGQALFLVGPCAVKKGEIIPWNEQRFRKVERNKQSKKRKAKKAVPAKAKAAVARPTKN